MAVAWVSEFDTGIIEIDEQHQNILHYINQLAASKDRLALSRVLEDLVEYTTLHFKFERQTLERAGVEFATMYKFDHAKFIEHLTIFAVRHDQGEDIIDDLYIMLSTWLINHLKRDHAAYNSLLQSKRLIDVAERVQTEKSAWMDRYFNRLLAE